MLGTRTVHFTFKFADGTARAGEDFEISNELAINSSGVSVPSADFTKTLDNNGQISVDLYTLPDENVRYFVKEPNGDLAWFDLEAGETEIDYSELRVAGVSVSPRTAQPLYSYVNEKIAEAIAEVPTVPTGGTINDYFRGDGVWANLVNVINSLLGTNYFNKNTDTSDNVTEGATNLFFTDQRAIDAVDLSAYALAANISAVGFSNDYNDLDNLPNLFSGNYNDLSNLPNLALKADLASPAFTGTPTAPTPINSTNTTQLATTAFVKNLIADLIDSAPGTLDSLNELAAALGDNPNFATDTANALALKLSKASNLSDLQDAGTARTNLGLATVAASGSYNDLSNLPTLFSGSYSDLSNKPTLNSFLPSQTGNSGKYLTTDGTNASWASVSSGGLSYTSAGTTNYLPKFDGTGFVNSSVWDDSSNVGTSKTQFNVGGTSGTDIAFYRRTSAPSGSPLIDVLTGNIGGSASIGAKNFVVSNSDLGQIGFAQYYPFNSAMWAGFASASQAGVIRVTDGSTGGGGLQFTERTAPTAPSTNNVILYAEDNGSGKTRLMALFPTGSAQQVAIEP